MTTNLDSSRFSLAPKQGDSSRYRNAQTQTSRRDRTSYHRIQDLQTVEHSPSGGISSPGPRTSPGSWLFNGRPAQTNSRSPALSGSRSVYSASSHQDSSIRDWEADLTVFRMSWYDELELFDANSGEQAEHVKKVTDPNIVEWDGPDDPQNPLNWPNGRKWANILTFSTITMIRQ